MISGKAIRRKFCCGECGFIFDSSTETAWANARPGDYWFTAQGNVAVCTKCRSYAHEIFTETEIYTEKEEPTMKVSYRGVEGELMKLERKSQPMLERYFYDLSIYDSENQVTHSFTNVMLEDVKFLGGVVSFGG